MSAYVWSPIAVVVVLAAAAGCTEPISRKKTAVVVVGVDADRIVRDETWRVEVEVHAEREPNSGWKVIDGRRFRDGSRAIRWPIEFTLDSVRQPDHSYSLLALAYDKRGAVVARGQAIRDAERAAETGLRVHFDSECFRQAELCQDGSTCYRMQCVSASDETQRDAADAGAETADGGEAGESANGIARAGESCGQEGARACAGHGSRMTLRCEGGEWQDHETCLELERCETTAGEDRGRCLPMARECINQEPNVPFCEAETMKVCQDLVSSEIRPCGENQRCIAAATGAECACSPGYVPDGPRCSAATECGDNRGGCDPLTECRMMGAVISCSACPAGYEGTGEEGCAPLLEGLAPSAGELEPAFHPDVRSYRIRVPIVSPRVEMIARAPARTRLAFDSTEVGQFEAWTSPVLSFEEKEVELLLTSESGVSTRYAITLERTGSQTAYIKASNSEANDWFGIALASDRETIAAGAYFEDGAARGLNGDQGNGAADSGAVYVFVRENGGFRQQAYVKPRDPAPNDFFGTSVSVTGDVLAVGAVHASLFSSPSANERSGAAYVFTRQAGTWSERQKLVASNAQPGDRFGVKVALSETTLAVGAAYGGKPGGDRGGAVYLFEREGETWRERQIVTPDQPTAQFGSSLSLRGDRLVVGAPAEDDNTGAVYVFAKRGDVWVQEQRLRPASIGSGAKFGFAAAQSADRIAVGAPRPPRPGSSQPVPAGEVFVYEHAGDRWEESAVLQAPVPDRSDYFGASLAFARSALIIGSNGEASAAEGIGGDAQNDSAPYSGAAYVFAKTASGEWVSTAYLKASNTEEDAAFGFDVAVGDSFLVVAAPLDPADATGINPTPAGSGAPNSGGIYVFE